MWSQKPLNTIEPVTKIFTSQTQPVKNKFWCSLFSFTQLTATSDKHNAYMNQHTLAAFVCSHLLLSSTFPLTCGSVLVHNWSVQHSTFLTAFQHFTIYIFPFPLVILTGQSKNKRFKPSQNMFSKSVLTKTIFSVPFMDEELQGSCTSFFVKVWASFWWQVIYLC
jgi:hypothetical protein